MYKLIVTVNPDKTMTVVSFGNPLSRKEVGECLGNSLRAFEEEFSVLEIFRVQKPCGSIEVWLLVPTTNQINLALSALFLRQGRPNAIQCVN